MKKQSKRDEAITAWMEDEFPSQEELSDEDVAEKALYVGLQYAEAAERTP